MQPLGDGVPGNVAGEEGWEDTTGDAATDSVTCEDGATDSATGDEGTTDSATGEEGATDSVTTSFSFGTRKKTKIGLKKR